MPSPAPKFDTVFASAVLAISISSPLVVIDVAPASPAPTEKDLRLSKSPTLSLNIPSPVPILLPVTSKLFAVVPITIVSLSAVTDINVPR